VLGLVLGLGLGLVNGSSLVGVSRHLAAVVSIVDLWSIHDGRVRSMHAGTTVVSVTSTNKIIATLDNELSKSPKRYKVDT